MAAHAKNVICISLVHDVECECSEKTSASEIIIIISISINAIGELAYIFFTVSREQTPHFFFRSLYKQCVGCCVRCQHIFINFPLFVSFQWNRKNDKCETGEDEREMKTKRFAKRKTTVGVGCVCCNKYVRTIGWTTKSSRLRSFFNRMGAELDLVVSSCIKVFPWPLCSDALLGDGNSMIL